MIVLDTTNLLKISYMNSTTLANVVLAIGLAMIHFVNLSTTTKRYETLPYTSFNGQTMSRHHVENAQVTWIV